MGGMRWDMEVEEVEAVLEKIWDLHDKLSDAIHSISRAHFLSSVKSLKSAASKKNTENRTGFVFVKDFRMVDQQHDELTVQEAKSLNAIRTALENLEDQLEFFHTVQTQQQAERDAAIARLEQSRIILAMRLGEHHGKKYKVIEEALAFVGDVHDTDAFVSPENLYDPLVNSGEELVREERMTPNFMSKTFISSFDFARRSLKLVRAGGILGDTALFAFSMVAFLYLRQLADNGQRHQQDDIVYGHRNATKPSCLECSAPDCGSNELDVKLARG